MRNLATGLQDLVDAFPLPLHRPQATEDGRRGLRGGIPPYGATRLKSLQLLIFYDPRETIVAAFLEAVHSIAHFNLCE